jgi:hypothetical protein
VRVIRSEPSVVTAVRELSRLEGAEFHIERVIELTETQRRLFGLVEAEDAILLVAAGEVVAGVDLSKVADADIESESESSSVVLRLPAPEVFTTRLDNERTYVHTRKTDVLARRVEGLETAARREAESTLAKAARDANIIGVAERSVRRTLEGLMRALGYQHVTIEFRPTKGASPPPSPEGRPE